MQYSPLYVPRLGQCTTTCKFQPYLGNKTGLLKACTVRACQGCAKCGDYTDSAVDRMPSNIVQGALDTKQASYFQYINILTLFFSNLLQSQSTIIMYQPTYKSQQDMMYYTPLFRRLQHALSHLSRCMQLSQPNSTSTGVGVRL